MRRNNTWIALSSALLVTCALSSCEMPRTISAYLGDKRTLPEGAEVNFSTPHRPLLNPTSDNLSNDQPARRAPIGRTQDSYDAPSMRVSSASGRRVPIENLAILSGKAAPDTMMAATSSNKPLPSAPSATATFEKAIAAPVTDVALAQTEMTSGLKAPASKVDEPKAADDWSAPKTDSTQVIATNTAATPAQAPTETLRLIPPAVKGSSTSVTANEASAEAPIAGNTAVPSEAKAIAAAAEKASVETKTVTADGIPLPRAEATADQPVDESKAPTLASVPEAPARTPAAQIANDMSTLTAEREANQAASTALAKDSSSTVMTNAETGALVANAAKAQPAAEDADKNFDGWLHNSLASDSKKPAKSETNTAAAAPALKLTPPAPKTPASGVNDEPKEQSSPHSAVESMVAPASALAEASPAAGEMKNAAQVATASANQQETADLTVPPAISAEPAASALAEVAPAAGGNKTTAKVEEASAAKQESVGLTPPTTAAHPAAPKEVAPALTAAKTAEAPPATPAATAPKTEEAVQLKAPPAVAEVPAVAADAKKQLTDVVAPADADATEANAEPAKQVRYLPEPRYAKRRLAPINEAY